MLVLFAGPGEAESNLPAHLRGAGCEVDAIDTKLGGGAHDVLRNAVAEPILHSVGAGEYDAVFIATPCSSYSVRHAPTLRSATEPEGILPIPAEWRAYVEKHNSLARFSARVIDACRLSATPVAVENPADRGDRGSKAFWTEHQEHGSLWRMPCMAVALGASAAQFHTFAQCAFESAAQKWTTVASTGELTTSLAGLGEERYGCAHGRDAHSEVLAGYDELGRSRAGQAAAYPKPLNLLLTRAIVTAAAAARARASGGAGAPTCLPALREGFVSDGPRLGPVGHAACEAARASPDRFSHPRHLVGASAAELCEEAFPGDLFAPVMSMKPKGTCTAMRRRPLTRLTATCERVGCCTTPRPVPKPRRPAAVRIADLFLDDVYASQVLSWLELADSAAAAIRAGATPPHVPTRVLGQEFLQPWARGIVWDCRNPDDCKPVQRSTRHTTFIGKRQVDRAALRRVAAELGWHDEDIVDQVGEGGVEVRSACSLDIVLAFHHQSLLDEIALAERTVADHVKEEWVAPPVRHLPFVPCRLQPRGVVMQQRSRLLADGVTLEDYEKPRITTDSSFGGPDSVNGGVPGRERSVMLPSIQSLGRGWAMCSAALGGDPDSTAGYCIDAESAYSFCPVQEADLWTQCFCWWDTAGTAGIATDRRMGFGGAFAPNRFERLSTLVAAYAQHMQAQFDAEQPAPGCAAQFTARRRALQRLGRLPPGDSQAFARFLQVFMDDFTGAAGVDRVIVPPSVAHILVRDEHMRAAGCVPAPVDSRVHVHARLTILALERVGLYAAPHKVAIGSPLPALGLLVDGKHGLLRCPEGKKRTIMADAAAQLEAALADGTVHRKRAVRLVGRLCHLTQVMPELRPYLHGGHTVANARWPGSGGRRGVGSMHLSAGSSAHQGWTALLRAAQRLVAADEGVSMAPRRMALGRDVPGTLTAFTDASGVSQGSPGGEPAVDQPGFGGYGFVAGVPNTVFILSELWPTDALSALAAASCEAQAELRRAGASSAALYLPMPAAELFCQVVLPRAVARLTACTAVYSAGDCEPSARVVEAMHSRNPPMRVLIGAARAMGCPWVSVHVKRDANLDGDRLSHPNLFNEVVADAKRANLRVETLGLDQSDWALLEETIAASAADGASRRPTKKRARAPAAAMP